MKRMVIIIAFVGTFFQVNAQSNNGVNIYGDPRIEFYTNKYAGQAQTQAPQFIYRILLIQTYNRDEANSVRAKFRNMYPNESSFLVYDDQKFKVRVGAFSSKVDAEVMLQQLRSSFPSSFILPPEKRN